MCKKKTKNKFFTKDKNLIFVPIIVFVLYGILDYVNILAVLKININNINTEYFSIFFDSLVVIVLYIITYFHIDKKRISKEENSAKVANVLMQQTYFECLDNLKLINDKQMLTEYILPKVDFNKPDSENRVVVNLKNLPFESFNHLMNLSVQGYVKKDKFEKYIWIKKEYAYIISIKITFFDLDVPENEAQEKMLNDITNRYNNLYGEITNELNLIK